MPSENWPALKKYGDRRPALVLNSPKRSTPVPMAKATKSRRKASGSPGGRVAGADTFMRLVERLRLAAILPTFMRIITLNVNGLRSAAGKGFMPWLRRQRPDVACLQEIKCQEADLTRALLAPRGYHAFFHPAEKPGYSGVGIYAKREPDKVVRGLGIAEFDAQGRYIQADFGNLSVVSVYFPSGSASEE